MKPGPRNLITDVAGLSVGNAEDAAGRTGVTMVLCAGGAGASGDARGGAPGTRATDMLAPACLIERVDALALAGGSLFGLAAADAAAIWLAARGRGQSFGAWTMPIVS